MRVWQFMLMVLTISLVMWYGLYLIVVMLMNLLTR